MTFFLVCSLVYFLLYLVIENRLASHALKVSLHFLLPDSKMIPSPSTLHMQGVGSSWIVEITLRLQLYTMVDVQTSH